MNRSSDEERRERIRQHNQSVAAESQSHPEEASPPQGSVKPGSGKARLALILLACLIGSISVSYVAFKFLLLAPVPEELVGTWQVTDGPLRGALLEFDRDGTVVATLTVRGKKEVTNQSAKVEGRKLILTSKDPDTKKDDTVIQTIISVTANELILRDEDKKTYRMKRVQN